LTIEKGYNQSTGKWKRVRMWRKETCGTIKDKMVQCAIGGHKQEREDLAIN